MKQEPRVSVIMNCFNGEKYLREAVDSVLSQTYQNWEVIFWDNQSTDRSAEIFKSYPDPRLKYFYAPKHTLLYEARNYAVEKASGEFLAFLDVDDRWLPEKLEKQLLLFGDSEVGIVCGDYWIENEQNNKRWKGLKRPPPTGWVLNDLLKSYFVGLVTLMIRRSAYDSLDYPFDPRYHISGDTDLVIRLSIHWKLDCVKEPVAFYRRHDNNETSKHRGREIEELECWWKEMKEVEAIRSCSNFHFVKSHITYIKAIQQIVQSNKNLAYGLFKDLPWGLFKLKVLILIVLPAFIVRRIKG